MICSMVLWDCWLLHWTGELLGIVGHIYTGPVLWLAFNHQTLERKP